MLSAREALAYASLKTPEDFSNYKHLEVRIMDSVRNGGMYIMHAGDLTDSVINCYIALGYHVCKQQYENGTIYKISWENV